MLFVACFLVKKYTSNFLFCRYPSSNFREAKHDFVGLPTLSVALFVALILTS